MELYVKEYQTLLLRENEKQNLVSRKTIDEELEKHIADSLALLSFVSWSGERIVDIGSGAGFPGLLLSFADLDNCFTLVESDLKKSGFLQQCVQQLHLPHVQVVRERAEILGQDPSYRETFTVCTSRAVSSIRVMVEYGLPLLKVGGSLYLWKGPKYQEEIDEAAHALYLLGAAVDNC